MLPFPVRRSSHKANPLKGRIEDLRELNHKVGQLDLSAVTLPKGAFLDANLKSVNELDDVNGIVVDNRVDGLSLLVCPPNQSEMGSNASFVPILTKRLGNDVAIDESVTISKKGDDLIFEKSQVPVVFNSSKEPARQSQEIANARIAERKVVVHRKWVDVDLWR